MIAYVLVIGQVLLLKRSGDAFDEAYGLENASRSLGL